MYVRDSLHPYYRETPLNETSAFVRSPCARVYLLCFVRFRAFWTPPKLECRTCYGCAVNGKHRRLPREIEEPHAFRNGAPSLMWAEESHVFRNGARFPM